MGNPAHEFSTLEEVADHFKTSMYHLLVWGAEGKLKFSIRLKTDPLIEKIDFECPACQIMAEGPGESGEFYPLSTMTLKNIFGDEKKRFHPTLTCKNCSNDLSVKLSLDANNLCFSEDTIGELYGVADLFIRAEDIAQFEQEHQPLIKADRLSGGVSDESVQGDMGKEKFPGLPGETQLSGLKEIAAYLHLTSDYLKHIWKEKQYPLNKRPRNRRLYAYRSQLDAWQSSE